MKILHTADWHVGRSIRGRSRLDEQAEVLGEIVSLAVSEAVDLVLVAGDQFDTHNPPPQAERLVYQTLLDLAEQAPVVVVAGNHDHPRRLEAVAPLLHLGRVVVASEPARPEDGGVIRPIDGVRISLLPFVSQRNIVRAADLMALDGDQTGNKYAARLAQVIDALCQDLTTDEVNLVVAHLMVHGGEVGDGERAAHTVFDYSIPAQSFPPALSYVALGHLHRHQRMPAAAPVWYSGSPLQLDFGEVEDRKGVLIVDVEPGLPARVAFQPLQAGRRLRILKGSLKEVEALAGDIANDDYVKVVLDEPATPGLADAVRAVVPQAIDVVLDPARRQHSATRQRRTGRSHGELFVEYLKEVDAHDERVVDLFHALVEEAHEA